MDFKLLKTDAKSSARKGEITTDHGTIQTPIFMPVGTVGSVKGIHQRELTKFLKSLKISKHFNKNRIKG